MSGFPGTGSSPVSEQGDKPVVTQADDYDPEFVEAWVAQEDAGYVYSEANIAKVYFGWQLARARFEQETLSSEREAEARKIHLEILNLHMECGSCVKWQTDDCRHGKATGGNWVGPSLHAPRCREFEMAEAIANVIKRKEKKLAAPPASEGCDVGREALDRSWPDCLDPNAAHNRRPKRYRKTALIEAVQWFKDGDHPAVRMRDDAVPWVETLEGGHIVTPGDWIATGVKGEHWPIKPDAFAATYEESLSTPPAPEQPDMVGELVEALEPFAEMAKHLDDTQQRRDALFCGGSPGLLAEITQHDYHRALAALAKYRSGDA